MSITKDLIKDLDFDVYHAFEDKIEGADIPEKVKVDFFDRLHKMVEDWKIELDSIENEIDDEIYDYSGEAIKDQFDDWATRDLIEGVI